MNLNCWEFKKCGRQPGGEKVKELGVCPAALDTAAHGCNGGVNGGRICWAVAGTFCGGTIQGEFAQKQSSCMTCDFYDRVRTEQGAKFLLLKPGQSYRARV